MKINKSNSEHYKWGNSCDGWHFVKNDRLSIIQELMPPGSEETEHYHQEAEQFFYVLDGILTIEMDGKVFSVKTNEGLHVLPNVLHQVKNTSKKSVEFLVISVPPSHGDRIITEK